MTGSNSSYLPTGEIDRQLTVSSFTECYTNASIFAPITTKCHLQRQNHQCRDLGCNVGDCARLETPRKEKQKQVVRVTGGRKSFGLPWIIRQKRKETVETIKCPFLNVARALFTVWPVSLLSLTLPRIAVPGWCSRWKKSRNKSLQSHCAPVTDCQPIVKFPQKLWAALSSADCDSWTIWPMQSKGPCCN